MEIKSRYLTGTIIKKYIDFLKQLAQFLFFGMILWRIIVIFWSKHFTRKAPIKERDMVGLVFGAGLEKNGTPSLVLKERVDTAAHLYHDGVIKELIMSGGNRSLYHNEPLAMKLQAQACGVPDIQIHLDPDGLRSFDSCLHLKLLIPAKYMLITQSFHLPRVLLISRGIGIDAVGYAASHEVHHPIDALWWHLREIPATARALIDILHWQFFCK